MTKVANITANQFFKDDEDCIAKYTMTEYDLDYYLKTVEEDLGQSLANLQFHGFSPDLSDIVLTRKTIGTMDGKPSLARENANYRDED